MQISTKILVSIVVFFIGTLLFITANTYFKTNETTILDFIKNNPDRAALKFIRNDSIIANVNADKMMPLASTVKLIVAVEYAEQASKGLINVDEKITLTELDKFYIPNTDGGAHPAWLKSIEGKMVNEQISTREIAKGMIMYSSNANTEWLMQKLNLKNINDRLSSLGIKKHDSLYYIVSALFVGKETFPKQIGKPLEMKLKALNLKDYRKTTHQIHQKLLSDTTYKNNLGDMRLNIQNIWSNNLPKSTVSEYARLMQNINSKTYFSVEVHNYLDEILEGLMQNPANKEWLKHAGTKGGSTAFVLTKALYATDKNNNTTEMALFFNDLKPFEQSKLQKALNTFILNSLRDKAFRTKIQHLLN